VAEHQCADRPGDEGNAEDAECCNQTADGNGSWEERGGDDRREGAIEGEVVPLDQIADAGCSQSAASYTGGRKRKRSGLDTRRGVGTRRPDDRPGAVISGRADAVMVVGMPAFAARRIGEDARVRCR
jgi:hypothetical protein